MRTALFPLLVVVALIVLAGLAACQAFTPAPITPLSDQPPTRLGPAPTAPPVPATPPEAAAEGANGLVIALGREPLSLDPGDVADPEGLIVLRQVYDTLVQYREGSAEVEAGLAAAWQANDNATEWTFTLRDGVRFHDGTLLTAEAVKFNFDRWLDPSFRAGNRAEGKQFQVWSDVFGGYRGTGSLVTDVEVVAPMQLRLRLSRPTAYLPALLALPYFGISSPTAVQNAGARYGSPEGGAVGSGAYRLVSWSGGMVRLARVADAWAGAAASETLSFRALGEADAQLRALADGRADVAVSLPPARAEAARALGLTPVVRSQLAVAYLTLNQRFRPLDDARVREALALALDPSELASQAFAGASVAADQFVPPGLWGRLPDAAPAPNVERARALLAEAGFADGLSEVAGPDGVARPLEVWVSSPPRGQSLTPLAEAVVAQLARAGIRARLRQDEWASFLAERKQGRFPLYLLVYPVPAGGIESIGDPHVFLSALFGPLTVGETAWNHPPTQSALRTAEATASMARREAAYRDIATAVRDHWPRLPLVYPTGLAATRAEVQGYRPAPVGAESLAQTRR